MKPEHSPSWADVPALREEALRLVGRAADRSLTLRVTGSLGILLRSEDAAALLETLGRRPIRDIDLMAYAREQPEIERLFEDEGWTLDPVIRWSREWGVKRLIYQSAEARFKVDVFLDQLVMSHTIDLRHRIELEMPTIPLADLLLSKLQIHEITPNDLLDVLVLLAGHDLGGGNGDTVAWDRLIEVLSDDWGFWYSSRLNLEQAVAALDASSVFPRDLAGIVRGRIGEIRARLDTAPKSRRWRWRSAVGPRLSWYQEVDEVERGEGSALG